MPARARGNSGWSDAVVPGQLGPSGKTRDEFILGPVH